MFGQGLGKRQLDHVQHGIRVPGKHAGAGCTVGAAFAALQAFGVVVAVDDGTGQLPANLIKLVAEDRHGLGAVLVAGDDLIDGVQNDGDVAFFTGPADELRGEFIHGHGRTAKVPDVDAGQILRRQLHGCVYVPKAVQAAGPIQLQIDVQHPPLGAGKAVHPALALGDGDGKLDQGEALACFRGAGQQHLVPLPQHSLDQRRGQRRQVLPVVRQAFRVRQFVGL